MRKTVLVAGLVVLLIGLAAVFVGFYEASNLFLPTVKVVSGPPQNSVVLQPAGNLSVGTVAVHNLGILTYKDTSNRALKLHVNSSATTVYRNLSVNGSEVFLAVVLGSGPGPLGLSLVNNLSTQQSVGYTFSSKIAPSALILSGGLILVGGVVFVIGLITAIVGAILKKKPAASTEVGKPLETMK
ncbi:MAG: hypothetical protein QW767_06040 [Thermoprotei archaeon]